MKLSVIIPCHNEEKSVGRVIRSLPPEVSEIIVVDNNSTDKTAAVAKKLGAKVVFEPSKGYGSALKAGFQNARGEVIVTLDGDSQYPAEKISEMVRYLEEKRLDFISGNRFPVKSSSMSSARVVGNKILTFVINLIFRLQLQDSQSGMWVFRKKILNEINLENNDMSLSEEIKIKVATHPSLRFEEYNIPYYPRIGESKLFLLKHGLTNFLFLLRLKLRYLSNKQIKKNLHGG